MMSVSASPIATTGARPIGLIVLAMAVFALQDMVVKLVLESVTLWQLQVVRSGATVLLMVLVLGVVGRVALMRPVRLGWPVIRAGFMALAYLLFYASLPYLALSQAAAAFFVGPLFITLLAALVLGEPIGPRRIAAVGFGFLGVLMIIRPWGGSLEWAALMPVGAALAYAVGIIVTRWRCHGETGMALTLVHNTIYLGIGILGVALIPLLPIAPAARAASPFLLEGWQAVMPIPLMLMLVTAVSHLIGVLCSIRAYQSEEASRLAPFEYSYLAIVPVLDVAVWGVVPDGATIAGLLLIAFAGVMVSAREGRGARPTVLPRGKPPVDAPVAARHSGAHDRARPSAS